MGAVVLGGTITPITYGFPHGSGWCKERPPWPAAGAPLVALGADYL